MPSRINGDHWNKKHGQAIRLMCRPLSVRSPAPPYRSVSDPFTEWRGKGQAPYWLTCDAATEARHLALLQARESLVRAHERAARDSVKLKPPPQPQ